MRLCDTIMRCSRLLSLVLFLHVVRCLEIQGLGKEPALEISENVTAVLGEEVYLSCLYLGESQIQSAEWKRKTNESSFERLAGFSNGTLYNNFSNSVTNLTVQVKVSSVEAEGEYICEFKSEEDFFFKSVFVTVFGRPDVQILVNKEVINNTSYQSVTCFADGGRPSPQISWLVGSFPPSGYPFTVNVSESLPSNGLFNLSSVLRFPTHLQDEDNVTCVIQHPTLPHPKLATVRVETYTRPNVTVKAEMVQQRGSDFWVVSCISSGGRPDSDISLALNTTESLQAKKDLDVQTLSVHLPAAEYDGHRLTCTFTHPKYTHAEERSITLPTFYLHKMGTNDSNFQDAECLELQEGETDVISLQITSNVPRYSVTCTKDDGPLPDNVELIGQNLTFLVGVKPLHAGLYKCNFFYHHLNAVLLFNVTVKPQPLQPVPPTISVGLRSEDGRWVIECVAAEAVPAANVSWLVSQSVSEEFWFNSTSYNGSHTVRGVLLVPVCSPWERAAKCVIHHLAFEHPENRSLTLPLCARPNITIKSSTEWRDGRKYTKVGCSVISVASAADIHWLAEDSSYISDDMQTELLSDGLVSAWSSVDLPSSLFSGQNVTCVVKHGSLETPVERTIQIPEHNPPLLSVTVMRQQDPPLWTAVCDCEGECVRTNLHWVLPKSARAEPPPLSEFEDNVMKATLTYQFPLALYEGQNLTCVYQFDHRRTENRTVQIPEYYITSVRILNHSSLLSGSHNDQGDVYGLRVQKNHLSHRILLAVEGNVPEYSLHCQRSDGSTVEVNESGMTLQDEGLYTCWASFFHHKASLNIQVEITDEEEQFKQIMVICISSVAAVITVVCIVLFVFCKKYKSTKYKDQETVSALTSLMQEPVSPEVKKPGAEAENKDIAQLVNYSIVLDVKSTL